MRWPKSVGEALVRYINQGSTVGSVNLPEVGLRSLTLDERNHARVCTPPLLSGLGATDT